MKLTLWCRIFAALDPRKWLFGSMPSVQGPLIVGYRNRRVNHVPPTEPPPGPGTPVEPPPLPIGRNELVVAGASPYQNSGGTRY